MRTRQALSLLVLVSVPFGIAGCAPVDEAAEPDPADPTPTGERPVRDGEPPAARAGTLTIGTDSPAFPPWFKGNDPTNGKGFESAVAYAVAEELGFSDDEVTWVKVPFNNSYKPGEKDFDFDINQISITPGARRGRRLLRRLLRGGPGRHRAGGHADRRRDQRRRPRRLQPRRPDRHHLADRDPRRRSSRPPSPPSSRTPTPPSRRCSTTRSTRSWPTCRPPSTSRRSRSRRPR